MTNSVDTSTDAVTVMPRATRVTSADVLSSGRTAVDSDIGAFTCGTCGNDRTAPYPCGGQLGRRRAVSGMSAGRGAGGELHGPPVPRTGEGGAVPLVGVRRPGGGLRRPARGPPAPPARSDRKST